MIKIPQDYVTELHEFYEEFKARQPRKKRYNLDVAMFKSRQGIPLNRRDRETINAFAEFVVNRAKEESE